MAISSGTISFFICTQRNLLNPTLPLLQIFLWILISRIHKFVYGYQYPEVTYLPMDIGIRKCQFCLWILTFRSVSFAYGYWYPEVSCLPMNIVIQNCTL